VDALLIIPVAVYSALMFVLWLTAHKNRLPGIPSSENKTIISIVVACHNEEKYIKSLLKCLVKQNYPSDNYEVIIVDDSSTDFTCEVINSFINSLPSSDNVTIRLYPSPGHGKKSAVRYGISNANGEVILTTDADCRMGPRWVSSYSACYEKCSPDMMLASVTDLSDNSFVSSFARYEFAALQTITEATALLGHPVMCNGANMGFSKEAYMNHAGELHDEIASGDDIFLLHAVKRSGGKISYLSCGAAAVETASAVSAAALLSQRARWASKAYLYRDASTIILAAVTAACNAAVTAAAIASCFNTRFIIVTGIIYVLRMIPDYLIISQHMKKRKEHMPLHLFIVMDLFYPFYFITVAFLSILPSMRLFRQRKPAL